MFEWDETKNKINQVKHRVSFQQAKKAFFDPRKIIVEDAGHSVEETRYFCMGEVEGGIMTVRFTYRSNTIRIIGAGYWRKGKKRYEKENQIYG
mgnify:CR=1 FL=1|jgi:uncharacterized protein